MNKPATSPSTERPDRARASSGTRASITPAAYFEQLAKRTALANWDDEGGVAIPREDWDAAVRLVAAIRDEVSQAPDVYPSACGDGSIHLRWSDEARALNAEIAGGELHWSVRTPAGRHRKQSTDASDLIRALHELFG